MHRLVWLCIFISLFDVLKINKYLSICEEYLGIFYSYKTLKHIYVYVMHMFNQTEKIS